MKLFKKLLLFILLLMPINVFALSYELDKAVDGEEGKGTKFIHIKIKEVEEGTIKTDELKCSVEGESVSCIVEPLTGYQVQDKMISKAEGAENPNLENDKAVGRVVITNTSKSEVTTKVTLYYGTPNEDGELAYVEKTDVKVGGIEIKSNDSTFKKLNFTPSTATIFPAFSPDVNRYTIYNIQDTVRKVSFTWECENCKVKLEGGTSTTNSTINIDQGENEGKIIVTSEDGQSTTTYYFTLIRGTTTFNSDKLKSIKLDDYEITPEFDPNVKEYEVTVPKKITNIEKMLVVETEDPNATKTIEGANKIDQDENTVKITVKAQDEKTNEYILKVKREDTTEEIIEVIYYKNKVVAFMNAENVREELSEDKFKEKYPTEYKKIEDKEYRFDEEGNIIKNQEVVDDDKEEEVKKEEKEESLFPWLIIILIVGAIIIIVIAGIIIFKEPKDKKDEEDPTPTKEEKENLDDIDTYNEEARLIAENNITEEQDKVVEDNTQEVTTEEVQEDLNDTIQNNVVETEENIVKEETIDDYQEEKSPTMDIDAALSDLMNTKEYNFKDK